MNHWADEAWEEELENVGNVDQRRERASMPVGRHARARAASKTSWKSRRTSNRHSEEHSGMHHRRRNRMHS